MAAHNVLHGKRVASLPVVIGLRGCLGTNPLMVTEDSWCIGTNAIDREWDIRPLTGRWRLTRSAVLAGGRWSRIGLGASRLRVPRLQMSIELRPQVLRKAEQQWRKGERRTDRDTHSRPSRGVAPLADAIAATFAPTGLPSAARGRPSSPRSDGDWLPSGGEGVGELSWVDAEPAPAGGLCDRGR
jgi:hypothetical protein